MNKPIKIILWAILLLLGQLFCITAAEGQKTDVQELSRVLRESKKYLPSDTNTADSLASKALRMAMEAGHDSLTGRAYYTLGIIQYYKGNFLVSSEFYHKALGTRLAKTDKAFASALWNNLGVNFEFRNENTQAVEAYFKSLQIAEELSDTLSIYQSYINIGFLFIGLKDLKAAEEYLTKALNYFTRQQDHNHMGLCFHNLAVLYQEKGNKKETMDLYDKAIDHYRWADNPFELNSVYFDKTNFLLDTRQFAAAQKHLKALIRLSKKFSNLSTEAGIELLRGKFLLYGQKKYQQAETCFLQAEKLYKQSNEKKQLINVYQNLANVYVYTGEQEKHMNILNQYDSLVQQFYHEASIQKIAEWHTLHKAEQKSRQRKTLEREIIHQKRLLLFAIAFLLLAASTVFLLLHFNRKTRNEHQVLFQRNMEMTKAMEKEKPVSNNPAENIAKEKLNQKFLQELFQRLKAHMLREKPFLDPHLKLSDLAVQLGTNEKYLSKAILTCHKTGFYEFIANYRINEAKKIFTTESLSTLRVKDVASRTGFSNPSTFQRKFKEITGMTPYTFLRIAHSQKPEINK